MKSAANKLKVTWASKWSVFQIINQVKNELETGEIPRGHRPRAQIWIFDPFYFRTGHQHYRKDKHRQHNKFCWNFFHEFCKIENRFSENQARAGNRNRIYIWQLDHVRKAIRCWINEIPIRRAIIIAVHCEKYIWLMAYGKKASFSARVKTSCCNLQAIPSNEIIWSENTPLLYTSPWTIRVILAFSRTHG